VLKFASVESDRRGKELEMQLGGIGVVQTLHSIVVGPHLPSSAVEDLRHLLIVVDLLTPPQTAVASSLRSWVGLLTHSAGVAVGVLMLSAIVEQLVHSLVVELQVLPQTAADDVRQSATCARTSLPSQAPCQMLEAAVTALLAASALLLHVRSSAESSTSILQREHA